MEDTAATQAFATIGHAGRLAVLRLLLRFAPQGVRPTEIAVALCVKQNTLSHHLAALVQAGLIRVKRDGRSLYYFADLPRIEALIGYLVLDVGRARPDLLPPAAQVQTTRGATLNVLFICSGNSARSIMAEALLRDLGAGRLHAFSAGTRPNSRINPMTLQTLARNDHAPTGLRAKHVSEFQHGSAPAMDFVFTVCDTAAAEECAPWPGQPITGHWGLPDPAMATGTDAQKALVFARTYSALRRRIAAFVELPFDALNRLSLQARIDALSPDHIRPDHIRPDHIRPDHILKAKA